MRCQKCVTNKASHRVLIDVLNLRVCTPCAIIALELEIPVEVFPRFQTNHQPGDTGESLDLYAI